MSAVKAQYFLNRNSYSSASSLGRRLLRARQTSMGSLPSKGEMTSLPTRYEICEMKVLICCSQHLQQILAGNSSCPSPGQQLQQQISQVTPTLTLEDTPFSAYACIQQIIGVQLPLNYRYIPLESMIDRLHQLKSSAALMGCSSSEDDLDNQQQPYEDDQAGENQIDEKFIEEIKSVRIMIAGLNSNNKRIQTLKHSYAKAIKSAQEKQNSDQMNEILQENAGYQNGITEKLKAIASEVKSSEEQHPNQPETRMKKNFYLNLGKQVRQVLQRQQNFQEQFKTTVKDKVTRQVRLIDRDIDDEQLQQYVDNPQLAQEMLQKKIYGQASTTLKNAVSDIQDKFRDIQKLQASVMQCVQLFNELSALVFAQGEKIDSIEANVAECKDYIQGAEKKLVKAKEHHQCSKKCMCIAIVIALVILIIIVIAVVATKA